MGSIASEAGNVMLATVLSDSYTQCPVVLIEIPLLASRSALTLKPSTSHSPARHGRLRYQEVEGDDASMTANGCDFPDSGFTELKFSNMSNLD